MDLGPSLRQAAPTVKPITGTRRVTGHTSRHRMDGARVTFDYINKSFIEGLTAYRQELESIGSRLDVASLSRNEQLAFWFNLHNVAVLEKISEAYPIDRSTNVKVVVDGQKVQMDDAKFLKISGQSLSLRDIRENIVFKNWSDPTVIYGFYRGNIGSPKISRSAFSGNRLDYMLEDNAAEFVNSLRGFRKGTRHRYVSRIYQELEGTLLKNFDSDLDAHLRKFAREDVIDDVNSGRPFKYDGYETMVSDLSGGRRLAASGNALAGAGVMPVEIQRFMGEVESKRRTLINKGLIKPKIGYVIIEDLIPEEENVQEETPAEPEN